ncbi:MAG TPA: D-Ala-D-Ala carboxypeptidase family metallohydrolase [Polyangiaceae bacterium]
MRVLLLTVLSLLFARDAPSRGVARPASGVDTPMTAAAREVRSASWADALVPIEVTSVATGQSASIRLYGLDGEIDEMARMHLEHVVARDGEQHELASRLEQLVVKAAHHFGDAPVLVVSGWREHAGRHTAGEALDFKLRGVPAAQLAAYLRGLPRVGVGIYTHPRTQYVHLDVREPSYHWVDGSPPGVTWRERQLRDPGQTKRDASWTPESDLP